MTTWPSGTPSGEIREVFIPTVSMRSLWKPQSFDNRISMASALLHVCEAYEVEKDEILGQSRVQRLIVPRQHAMWIMSKQPHLTLSMIGRFFNRDHTTVVHAIRRHQARLDGVMREQEAA